jgi:hypothetical protein
VSQNRLLRRIFGSKREGGWKRLDNWEPRNLYASLVIIRANKTRRMRWVVHVALTRNIRNAYSILVGKLEGKRPLGRSMRKWKDIIMILKEEG